MHFAMERTAYQEAILYGESILNLDPLREEVYRALMICYLRLGSFSDVAKQFHLCSQILWEELRVLPLPETVALFDQMLVNRYQTHSRLPHPPKDQEQLRQVYLQYQEASAQLVGLLDSQ